MSRVNAAVLDWTRVGSAPVNQGLPQVVGSLIVGATVSFTPGDWTGNPTSFAFQARENGLPISGATNDQLTLTSDLLGTFLSVTVIASNLGGPSLPATSLVVGPVMNPAVPTPSLDFSDPNNSQYLPLV